MMEHYGWLCLIPTLVVLLIALKTHKTFEALLGVSVVGMVLLLRESFFTEFTVTLTKVMIDPTIGWIILVCGLFGSLIQLLVKTGGTHAFAHWLARFIDTPRKALLMTWLLGLVIFIDDYLNALTVGNSMKKLTDQFRIPREMLAYVVDSTAAPICVLIPLSTWSIYVSGLLETTGAAATGEGLVAYISAIPYMAYGWLAVLIVPLVIMRVVPGLGAMKKAELRVAAGGALAPENSPADAEEATETRESSIWDFFLPIIVLIGVTILADIDALQGVVASIAFIWLYQTLIRRKLNWVQALEESFTGFKHMIYALAIIIMSFVLKEVNEGLGLTAFVIEGVLPIMNKAWLPAIAFLTLSAITFATGSFWGVYASALPIIIPLSQQMGVDPNLAIGAVISAGAFGSHACFYGDATVLSASATGCNNMVHALSQLPYALLAALLSTGVFVVLGMVV